MLGVSLGGSYAARAELWLFEEGNHVCMNLTYRWRPQAADWLAERLSELS